jgi:hypothetical protein
MSFQSGSEFPRADAPKAATTKTLKTGLPISTIQPPHILITPASPRIVRAPRILAHCSNDGHCRRDKDIPSASQQYQRKVVERQRLATECHSLCLALFLRILSRVRLLSVVVTEFLQYPDMTLHCSTGCKLCRSGRNTSTTRIATA